MIDLSIDRQMIHVCHACNCERCNAKFQDNFGPEETKLSRKLFRKPNKLWCALIFFFRNPRSCICVLSPELSIVQKNKTSSIQQRITNENRTNRLQYRNPLDAANSTNRKNDSFEKKKSKNACMLSKTFEISNISRTHLKDIDKCKILSEIHLQQRITLKKSKLSTENAITDVYRYALSTRLHSKKQNDVFFSQQLFFLAADRQRVFSKSTSDFNRPEAPQT